jgi:patatin-related protein
MNQQSKQPLIDDALTILSKNTGEAGRVLLQAVRADTSPVRESTPDRKVGDTEIEREIRFAVVIYGGVSLTIYINGVVQEMLHLVRSTADEPGDLSPVEQVYRELATVVGEPAHVLLQPREPKPLGDRPGKAGLIADSKRGANIRSRFIVDILSGTSAGGINAIYLAKALANNLSLESLAELWITQADLNLLLNDKKVSPGYLFQDPRPSLLNSRWMYLQLLTALNKMNCPANAADPEPLVEDLDLFCTTTDLRGLTIEIPLTDEAVKEERYRNFYHFKRRPGDPTHPIHDFTSDMDPFLAFAARCTSSFPIAFEPMQLGDISNVIIRSNFKEYLSSNPPDAQTAALFGPEIAKLTGASKFREICKIYQSAIGSQVEFSQRPFGDGGYLDNKPFTYAIETMKTRHAQLPVDRKLIYIEPSPQDIAFEEMQRAGALTRPNAVENSLDALIVLPRYETIRQDLEEVIKWNADISRLHRVIDFINDAIRKDDLTLAGAQSPLSNATYHRLRLSGTSDQLGDRLAAAAGVDPYSAQGQAIRSIAGIWRELYYPPIVRPGTSDEQTFLDFFDLDYCERAIRFLRLQLQQLREPKLKSDSLDELAKIAALFMALDDAPFDLDINAATKSTVAYDCWVQYLNFIVDPQAAARAMGVEFPYPDGMATKPPGVVAKYPPVTFRSFYSASDAGRDARVRWLFNNSAFTGLIVLPVDAKGQSPVPVAFGEIVNTIAEAIRSFYTKTMASAPGREPNIVKYDREPAGLYFLRAMNPLFKKLAYLDPPILDGLARFQLQDSQIYPITFGTTLGEFETVDIFRISPQDTRPIAGTAPPGTVGSPDLRGQSLGAFGAFLDQEWRLSDMLRGRLDGAERLITAILPDSDADTMRTREHYIQKAQNAIAEEWKDFVDGLNLSMSSEKKRIVRSMIDRLQLSK